MSRPYVLIPCECEKCLVVNTQAVRIAGTKGYRVIELHGTDATGYLNAQRRGTERVGEIGERLRSQFGMPR